MCVCVCACVRVCVCACVRVCVCVWTLTYHTFDVHRVLVFVMAGNKIGHSCVT